MEMFTRFNQIVPLSPGLHKGQCGKIAINGGCFKYTGAPYFAGISALKLGGDLVTIFCHDDAALAIKSYSPELMVCGSPDPIVSSFEEYSSLVFGPGYGRRHLSQAARCISMVLGHSSNPIVIDGDGLWIIARNPSLLKNHQNKQLILTPNSMEFRRLWQAFLPSETPPDMDHDDSEQCQQDTQKLAQILESIIVRKGSVDIIASPLEIHVVREPGCPRRCGGQGDVLAGSIGLFSAWGAEKDDIMAGVYGACVITRRLARNAFDKVGYSMTTSNLINEIPLLMKVRPQGMNSSHLYLQTEQSGK